MYSSKTLAVLIVATMLVVAIVPSFERTDAEPTEIIDGISINTDGMDGDAFSDLASSIIQVLNVIRADVHDLDFTDDENPEDTIKEMLEEASEDLELDLSDSQINDILNSIGTVPMILLSSSKFSPSEDVEISGNGVETAVEFPEYLIRMFTGDDSEPVEVEKLSEMGIKMDIGTLMKVKADEDVSSLGMFTTGFMSSISDSLGQFSSIANNLLVIDNMDLMKGRDVNIPSGSEYELRTNTNIVTYVSFEADSDLDSGGSYDSNFVDFKIGLHVKGSVDVEMKRISGDGPELIKTGVDFNKTDLNFSLGFDNIGSGSPSLVVGIDKMNFDIAYKSDVDGDLQTCTVKDSGVINVINGIKLSVGSSVTSDGFKDVPISSFKDNSGEKRDAQMESIIDEAKSEAVTEEIIDSTNQYITGGALAIVGILIIILIGAGKKY